MKTCRKCGVDQPLGQTMSGKERYLSPFAVATFWWEEEEDDGT